MPNVQDRVELGSEELREKPLTGPFGGIQSELPVSLIEDYGFADCQNIAFRLGTAQHRPTYVSLPPLPGLTSGEFVTTFATFYDSLGLIQQVVLTNLTRILSWNGTVWTVLTGPPLPVFNLNPFSTAVLNGKLCFSLGGAFGNAPVFVYDPQLSPGTYVLTPNSSLPTFLAEIGLHLMTSNVNNFVTGYKPQRYQWSGAGDPTDWISFSAGVNDLLVDLGPSLGLAKLGQYGFGFHNRGIVQIIPTGIGASPFAFVPLVGSGSGASFYYSLQKVSLAGVDSGIYAGPDNIYMFNQTSLQTIGDAPIGQRRRLGARSRIMADIVLSGPFFNTRSHITYAPGGFPYISYYLLSTKSPTDPSVCPLWVFNFDEENWTRWIFNKVPVAVGDFSLLTNFYNAPSNTKIGIAFIDGTVGYMDFGQAGSEVSSIIKSGKCIFGDRRHRQLTPS